MSESHEAPSKLSADALIGLLALQELDDRIVSSKGKRSARPGELATAKAKLKAAFTEFDDSKSLATATQKRIDEQTLVADALKADADKLEGQLYSLKSNDEFELMKKQIRAKLERESDAQDKVLELMLALDELKEVADQKREGLADEEKRFQGVEASIERQLEELEVSISSLESEREEAAGKLDESLRDLYEGIRVRRDGKGIAPVDASQEMCAGCHTQVMMQIVNAVMSGQLMQCPHCDRILYLKA